MPLRFVGLDTRGTPADPETVKDDAIGGVTDPASIPGRVKERAETIASKLPSLPSLPNLGGSDTKGTPADPETVKDDAIGGVTDPGSIPGRVKERAGTIASKLPNAPSLPNVSTSCSSDDKLRMTGACVFVSNPIQVAFLLFRTGYDWHCQTLPDS